MELAELQKLCIKMIHKYGRFLKETKHCGVFLKQTKEQHGKMLWNSLFKLLARLFTDVLKNFWCICSSYMNTDAIPKTLFIPLFSPCPYDPVCSNTVHKVLVIVYLSAVYTKSPTLLSRKGTAPLQSFSPKKRLQMSDRGAGEHCQVRLINETSVWNQLNPSGNGALTWASAVCSCDCEQQLPAPGALAAAFLQTHLAHLGERVA